jgi:3alpha(or 20beta)-hydroxysteroid dehydrogenase
MNRLNSKVALVTGGARGIGEACARAVVANGGQVVIADLSDESGQGLGTELGERARYVHLDVTSADEWAQAVAFTLAEFGTLNVLVNNAGTATFGPLGTYTRESWDALLAVNLTGPFLGMSAARDALVASAPAAIVNVSSAAGMVGSAQAHGYTASKFGLRGLTKSVALELGAFGVRCNSVHPGPIRTPFTQDLDMSLIVGPLGRMGEPEEVANLVVYLASDESSFSTGSEFMVDGGQIAGIKAMPRD